MNNITDTQTNETVLEIEYSPAHIKQMQNEGQYDAYQGLKPQYPNDRYYMEAYYAVKL